jgi:hypothetical protein
MKSKIQKNVLMLYRDFLKLGNKYLKEEPKSNYQNNLRKKFEENRSIPRIKINFIEFKLREGKNLLAHLTEYGFNNSSFTS